MTRLTALIIRSNPDQIECLAGGPVDEKYAGWIFYNEDRGEFSNGTKISVLGKEEAVSAMQKIVADVLSL